MGWEPPTFNLAHPQTSGDEMAQQQFTKDGHTVTVSSARAAVKLAYDGWLETASAPEPTPAEDPAKTAAKKTSK